MAQKTEIQLLKEKAETYGTRSLNEDELIKLVAPRKKLLEDFFESTQFKAMEELVRRKSDIIDYRAKVTTSKCAFDFITQMCGHNTAEVEEFWVIFLNHSNKYLGKKLISKGGITATVVDPRIIFSAALKMKGCTQIVMSHNHPSGNLTPSEADKKMTAKIKEAGLIMEIRLIDHIIVSGDRFYSFSDEGQL